MHIFLLRNLLSIRPHTNTHTTYALSRPNAHSNASTQTETHSRKQSQVSCQDSLDSLPVPSYSTSVKRHTINNLDLLLSSGMTLGPAQKNYIAKNIMNKNILCDYFHKFKNPTEAKTKPVKINYRW